MPEKRYGQSSLSKTEGIGTSPHPTPRSYLSLNLSNSKISQRAVSMEAATLTIGSRRLASAAAPAWNGTRRGTAAATPQRPGAKLPRRLRALPPELSEILAPKLVPGSPADTGDVSSLIPISAVMLLFYFVSNWVFPAVVMRGMQPTAEDEAAAAEAESMASSSQLQRGDAVDGKIRRKVKRKKSRKAATEA
ncbi:hypothetical protein VPH35_013083 [Triticum aestivum]